MTELTLLGSPTSFPPLPQRWDGDRYEWADWQDHVPSSLDIHRAIDGQAYRCAGCGTSTHPYFATGRRHPSLGEMFAVDRIKRTRSGSEYITTEYEPAHTIVNLHATRCGWCGHTEVYDETSDELWTLDDTDYGPTGSTRPTETPHPDALAAEEHTQ